MFYSSKMRSTTALMFVFVVMAALYVTTAHDGRDCMCMCCRGNGCTPSHDDLDMFTLHVCSPEACLPECKIRYADSCNSSDSQASAMCMAPMSASHIFNRYTTIGAFTVASIATVIFRI